jgi:hypothetical protein
VPLGAKILKKLNHAETLEFLEREGDSNFSAILTLRIDTVEEEQEN